MGKYGLVALLLILPGLALAQHRTYMAIQGGGVWLQSADNTGGGINIESDYKTGYGIAFRVGDQFAQHWRAEWELAYAQNDVNKLTIKNDGGIGQANLGYSLNGYSASADGSVSALSGMLNTLYDFTPNEPFHPYIGAGLGVTHLRANSVSINGVTVVDDSTTAFAYQGIAGIELDMMPQTAVFFNYNYFAAMNPQLTDKVGEKFDTEYKSNTFSLGLRYFFR